MSEGEAHHVVKLVSERTDDDSIFYLDSIGFLLGEMDVPERLAANLVEVARNVSQEMSSGSVALKILDAELGRIVCRAMACGESSVTLEGALWPHNEYEFRSWCYEALGQSDLGHRQFQESVSYRRPFNYNKMVDGGVPYGSRQQEIIGALFDCTV